MPFLSKLTKRLAASFIGAGLAVAMTACGDHQLPLESDAPALWRVGSTTASISISPSSAAGTLGQSAQFTATAYDSRGRVITGKSISWTSSDSTVVAITASGYASGIGVGHANLIATADGVTASAPVSVDGVAIASISLDPTSASGGVGQSARFTATVRDASGNVLSGRRILWASGNASLVTVDTTGYATGIAEGSTTVTATSAGIVATAAATVTASTGTTTPVVSTVVVNPTSASGNVGDAAQFTAAAYDANGGQLTGQTVTWTSTNLAVVTVSSAGYATAVGAGTASLVATVAGKTGTSAITVLGESTGGSGGSASSETVSPASANLLVGATQQLTSAVSDALGTVLSGLVTSWSSSDASVATVSASGLVTAVAAGSATITANTLGVVATSSITVTSGVSGGGTSAGWANAPASYPVISDQPFDQLTSLSWFINYSGPAISQDPTAPQSASNVLQFTYPAGMAGGGGEGAIAKGLPNTRRVYAGFWVKASANWQGHVSNVNKLAFMYTNSDGPMCIMFYGVPGGPYHLQTAMEFGTDPRFFLPANVADVSFTPGSWHKVEWLVDMGTSGTPNGVVKFWLDGTLVGSYNDVLFPSSALVEYQFAPTWGGIGDTKEHTDYLWYDHVLLKGY